MDRRQQDLETARKLWTLAHDKAAHVGEKENSLKLMERIRLKHGFTEQDLKGETQPAAAAPAQAKVPQWVADSWLEDHVQKERAKAIEENPDPLFAIFWDESLAAQKTGKMMFCPQLATETAAGRLRAILEAEDVREGRAYIADGGRLTYLARMWDSQLAGEVDRLFNTIAHGKQSLAVMSGGPAKDRLQALVLADEDLLQRITAELKRRSV